MKLFLTFLALFAVSTAGPVLQLTPQQELQSIAEFWDNVKRIYNDFVDRGAEFVCSKKLQELMDILGLPDQLDGAVEVAQQWLCGEEEALMASSQLHVAAISDFVEEVKRIYGLIKAYGKNLVCGSDLHDLLDLLGGDDRLDGAVKMAQSWFCDEDEIPTAESQVQKREIQISPERRLQSIGAFMKTVKLLATRLLKNYLKGVICSSRLQQLMDLLEVPDKFDGAVEMAQDLICASGILSSSIVAKNNAAFDGFIETVLEVLERFYDLFDHSYVCNANIRELMNELKYPDTMIWAVEVAVDWYCN